MAPESAGELIELAIRRVHAEIPALEPLKLVIGVELRGRGDVQLYRVELPGASVAKGPAPDARVRVALPRSELNRLATKGSVGDWRVAIERGAVRVSGPEPILRLVAGVAARAGSAGSGRTP